MSSLPACCALFYASLSMWETSTYSDSIHHRPIFFHHHRLSSVYQYFSCFEVVLYFWVKYLLIIMVSDSLNLSYLFRHGGVCKQHKSMHDFMEKEQFSWHTLGPVILIRHDCHSLSVVIDSVHPFMGTFTFI